MYVILNCEMQHFCFLFSAVLTQVPHIFVVVDKLYVLSEPVGNSSV